MQHPSFGALVTQNSTIRPRSKSALPGIEVSQMKWNMQVMQVHAKPKKRGRRQSWMSISPFPAFDAHSNGARLSQQCYPIFCLFPGCNVQCNLSGVAMLLLTTTRYSIPRVTQFAARSRSKLRSIALGGLILRAMRFSTTHKQPKLRSTTTRELVMNSFATTQNCHALVPSNDQHVFATTYVESMERRSRNDVETRSYAAQDTFDAIPALGKPPLARMENHVVAVSVRKLTRANRTEALD
ncbi:hypothetical protein Purlil1_13725 [Purpureocillium lilacinum]|uniref:Uncharacterized protein n=1 Tax=Purpureocillium lilacinum TaxID=33203 RepID=A0ABR0BDD6_PURLI|nr:hypothetical protein Purlil1_13725 [Purpureocillium lilacinum]